MLKLVSWLLNGIVAGAGAGLLVAALDTVIAGTVGECVGGFLIDMVFLVCLVSAIYGAIYGAAIGAALVVLATISIPRALERSSCREMGAYLLAGGTLGSIISWLMAGGLRSCGHWGPFIWRSVRVGSWDLFYVGPHPLVVVTSAIFLFAGLILRQRNLGPRAATP